MTDTEHDIEVIRRWAAVNSVIERVHIFGSRARGTHRPDSDLDIAVEHGVLPGDGDHFTTGLFGHAEWQSELQPLCRCQLQVESYRPGETPTVETGIMESSRVIYDRAVHLDNVRRMYSEALHRINDASILARSIDAQSDSSALLEILGFEILLKAAVLLAGCPRDRLDYSHRYWDLWNKLPATDRAEVVGVARARMPHHADLSDMPRLLNAWRYVFEQGRYYYELYENWTLDQQREFGEYWAEIGAPIDEAEVQYYPQERTCMIDALKAYIQRRLP
jgi:predicted nucleotidyltransferase